ncbi:hypothetical protein HDU96_005678 [Phlyctochytrium bullatum]|nr:hypothetical protein HDU96_005678 [Phlyctochytrium bullatum]
MPSTLQKTTTFKLQYFGIRGLSELIRMLLSASGCEWTEESPEWPAAKSLMPFGQMPLLIEYEDDVEVFRISQSKAIERYLALKFAMGGSTPREQATLESVYESYLDMVQWIRTALITADDKLEDSDPAKYTEVEEILGTKIPARLAQHAKILDSTTGLVLHDGRVTYVDMAAYLFFERLKSIKDDADAARGTRAWEAAVKAAPVVERIWGTVGAHPVVKAHVESEARKPVWLA